MSTYEIRIYKGLDIADLRQHLLVYGDLTGSCANCQALDIKLDSPKCPQCQTDFKYIAFRNVRNHLPKWRRLREQRPGLVFVDCEDFHRALAAHKAKEFLK